MAFPAELNRGDTMQDKQVKEAKSKCRTIACLLTDAPNPHSKGVLMFKKRRQRSKKYTLTSFGSVDEDKCQDSQEEDGMFPGSESEFDDDVFSAAPDPTWDSDYLDMLERRATAGAEGRGDGMYQFIAMSPPHVAPKPATASVTFPTSPASTAETSLPELPASNVLNRTARPFTPGFISIRAATGPVAFRPTVTKMTQRPVSESDVPPMFSTASEVAVNVTSLGSQLPSGHPSVFSPPSDVRQGPSAPTPEAPVAFYPPAIFTSVKAMQSPPPVISVHQAPFTAVSMPIPPAPQAPRAPVHIPPLSQIRGSVDSVPLVSPHQVPVAQPPPPKRSMARVSQVVSQPEAAAPTPVPGLTGRTGILLEARRRSGKLKPMFNVPDVKKNSPNPELLSMVQNLDERCTRQKSSLLPTEAAYDAEERSIDASTGKVPPPVAPKPRVIQEAPQILQAGGKGAQLFARRQNRMSMYAVDAAPYTPYQQDVTLHSAVQPLDSTLNPSLPPQFKYSPNIRAPPPIGYNPLLSPSIPTGPQRNTSKPESKGRGRSHKEGIKALDAMRRQPYQLNSAMFSSATNLSPMPSYQIPIKKARVYEIKRFSTPTPMSAPTLSPKVIAPRSATTLGEPGWPSLPKFSAMPIPNPVLPLSILSSLPPVQAPKPHFVATKGGVLPHVWRPGAM
uniref:Synaptopodin 2-like a n=1 Tax=Monopterus albus TaxID=43700 RepID=A0A3Q3R889_MONAL